MIVDYARIGCRIALAVCLLAAAAPAEAGFRDNGNHTVTDEGTGLTWLQESSCVVKYAGCYPGFSVSTDEPSTEDCLGACMDAELCAARAAAFDLAKLTPTNTGVSSPEVDALHARVAASPWKVPTPAQFRGLLASQKAAGSWSPFSGVKVAQAGGAACAEGCYLVAEDGAWGFCELDADSKGETCWDPEDFCASHPNASIALHHWPVR